MPSANPAQTSFAGGELSPRLRGRVDAELYRRGLEVCENFEPMPQGALRMRCGTTFVRDLAADGATDQVRLLPFRMANEQDYLLALLDRKMRIYALDGATATAEFIGVTDLLTNGDFSGGAASWSSAKSSVGTPDPAFSGGKVALFQGSAAYPGQWVEIYQSVVLGAATDLELQVNAYNWLNAKSGVTILVGTGGAHSADLLNYGPFTDKRPAAPVVFNFTGVGPATVTVTIRANQVPGGADDNGFDVDDVHLYGTAPTSGTDITTPWSADQVGAIQVVPETGVDRMIFVHPEVAPHFLQFNGIGSWTFQAVSFSGQPAEWQTPSWPGACEIFQGRLYLGGVPGQRNRLWASRVGSLFDFTLTTSVDGVDTVLPTDAIDVKISTKGSIRGMQSGRNFLLGTDLGEHSITSQGGFIAPNDIEVRDESAFGSCAVQWVTAGELALYVSGDRRKVRALRYDLQSSGWNSKDITFPAEHVTSGLVKELHHARDPNGTVVLVLEDGTLAACTFDPGEGVAAWWRLTVGDAVRSVAVSHGPEGSFLWLAVSRGAELWLERLSMAEADAGYLDAAKAGVVGSFILEPEDPVFTGITGISHLNGLAVQLVVGGVIQPVVEVVGGQVPLGTDLVGQDYVIGLAYTATARTLPLEGGAPSGTSQVARRRWSSITLRLNDSAIPVVNGERAAERSPETRLDDPTARMTGDVSVNRSDWADGGRVTIEQDLPLRTEVLAIFGAVQVNQV